MVERLIREGEGVIVSEGVVDGRRLLRGLAARRRWIGSATFAAFAAALVFVEFAHPRYMGVAKVLIENQESYYTRPDKSGPEAAAPYDAEAVQSVAEALASFMAVQLRVPPGRAGILRGAARRGRARSRRRGA